MEHKNHDLKTFFSAGERRIVGIASHIGDPADLDNDIIAQGAFAESIQALKNGAKIKLLDGHAATGATTVGIITKLWMDGTKLMFEAKISESSSGEDIYVKLKEGILDQVSIGFRIKEQSFRKDGVRVIEGLELMEISVVPIPANPGANILAVKASDEAKSAQPIINNLSEESPESETLAEEATELYKQHLRNKLNYLNRSNNDE